jgi:hypothetical protein
MYTLAHHPRIPANVRAEFQRLGLAKDEFVETDNWPHQLYVREARRMISDGVMTQAHCQQKIIADDPVGLGAYNMDSHNVQRYVTPEGHARNEGDIQVGVSPYRITYKAIRPKETDCPNLLAPVCLAASHIAYGSIRMEPVFMVLGQSAATAACLAIDAGSSVQQVPYPQLRERLLADGQVLEWTGAVAKGTAGIDARSLPGVVVDNTSAALTGEWVSSASIPGYVGTDYLHDGNEQQGEKRAVYTLRPTVTGPHEVRAYFTANSNRATNVPVTVESAGEIHRLTVNQRQRPMDRDYAVLGTFPATTGQPLVVTITNAGANGYVVIDAVQAVPLK